MHGILNTLLQPEEVRRKSVEYRRAQGRDLQRPDGALDRAEPRNGETRGAASKRVRRTRWPGLRLEPAALARLTPASRFRRKGAGSAGTQRGSSQEASGRRGVCVQSLRRMGMLKSSAQGLSGTRWHRQPGSPRERRENRAKQLERPSRRIWTQRCCTQVKTSACASKNQSPLDNGTWHAVLQLQRLKEAACRAGSWSSPGTAWERVLPPSLA